MAVFELSILETLEFQGDASRATLVGEGGLSLRDPGFYHNLLSFNVFLDLICYF